MQRQITAMWPYFKIITVYLLVLSWLLHVFDKVPLQLWLNQLHTSYLDVLFRYVTHLGDGLFGFALLPVFFYFLRLRTVTFIFISCILTGVVTQILKRLVFPDAMRPTVIISEAELHLIDGVHQLSNHAFPSGHNMFAFALFTCLAYVFRQYRWAQIGLGFTVIIVGYSRIYLSQHWVIDAVVGQILGVLCFFAGHYLMKHHFSAQFGQRYLTEVIKASPRIQHYKSRSLVHLGKTKQSARDLLDLIQRKKR